MSINFETKIIFNVSQEKAYNALLNLDAAKQWMQGLAGMEQLDKGPLKVGSVWKETRKMFGKEASEYFEVKELQEPERIVLWVDGSKGSTGKGEYLYTYLLKPNGDSTEINLKGEIKGMTGIAKLMGKMLAGTFKKACEKDLISLKNYLEQ